MTLLYRVMMVVDGSRNFSLAALRHFDNGWCKYALDYLVPAGTHTIRKERREAKRSFLGVVITWLL